MGNGSQILREALTPKVRRSQIKKRTPKLIGMIGHSALRGLARNLQRVKIPSNLASRSSIAQTRYLSVEPPEPPSEFPPPGPGKEPWIPEYEDKFQEPINEKRARLLYQSRKRGMLENGLLFGSFANKHLNAMTEEQLVLYDRLINLPSNDWEIYYWAVGQKATPEEFDNEVMDMLKEHAKNKDRESRIQMPDL